MTQHQWEAALNSDPLQRSLTKGLWLNIPAFWPLNGSLVTKSLCLTELSFRVLKFFTVCLVFQLCQLCNLWLMWSLIRSMRLPRTFLGELTARLITKVCLHLQVSSTRYGLGKYHICSLSFYAACVLALNSLVDIFRDQN